MDATGGELERERGLEAAKPAEPDVPGGATWGEAPGLVARGVCMGSADVVPGVSGGTMALILGIYARLIRAIKSFDRDVLGLALRGRFGAARDRVAWRFLGAIVTGQALGIVLFTKVIPLPRLIEEYPEPVYGAFFGLIVASIVVLGRDIARGGVDGRVIVAAAGGAAFGFAVVRAVQTDTPETPWFVFLCGCVAICAMILPGISGSYILLILRKYAYVLGSVGEVIKPTGDEGRLVPFLTVVLPFGLGALVGIAAFSRLLSWLLDRAERATLSFMTGLMAGSLWVIWPFQERIYDEVRGKQRLIHSTPQWPDADTALALPLALAVAGFLAVLLMDRVARGKGDPAAAKAPKSEGPAE